jgi:hypothetical protein
MQKQWVQVWYWGTCISFFRAWGVDSDSHWFCLVDCSDIEARRRIRWLLRESTLPLSALTPSLMEAIQENGDLRQ